SMTYHKSRNRLECHYCGSTQAVPKTCPKCDSKYVYFFGEGSEHLEERLRKEFPGARIARLDRDTARTKQQYQETLGAFASGALDILVDTGCGPRGPGRLARSRADPNLLPGALRHPGRRKAGLSFFLRARDAISKD